MKVVHINPTTTRKVSSLPVTGNYLIPEKDGRFRWAEPNDDWRLYSYTGGSRYLIANIRFDDTDHSPDLWIYSVLKASDERSVDYLNSFKPVKKKIDDLVEDNRIHLDRGRKWFIRQFSPNPDKLGINRFTGLPLNAWRALWRKTISPNEIEIYGMANNQMKIFYSGIEFNTYLNWSDLLFDMKDSSTVKKQGGARWQVSQIVMPWLQQHCHNGFIPFSDYDVMLPEATDEVIYTIDVAGLS